VGAGGTDENSLGKKERRGEKKEHKKPQKASVEKSTRQGYVLLNGWISFEIIPKELWGLCSCGEGRTGGHERARTRKSQGWDRSLRQRLTKSEGRGKKHLPCAAKG